MTKKQNSIIKITDPKIIKGYTPFIEPIPSLDIETATSGEIIIVCISKSFIPYINALVEPLTWDDNFTGTEEQKRHSVALFEELRYLLTTGNNCMTDPCCPETNEILNDIKTTNITIAANTEIFITNQNTVINNQETVIALTETQVIQQFITNYQSFVVNNQETRILNKMLYDGTPQSIAPSLGDDFSSDNASQDALCLALKMFMEQEVYSQTSRGQLAIGISAAVAGALIGLGIFTGGASVAAGFAVSAAAASTAAYMNMLNNPEAQRRVLCCLFDSMKDQPITEENFQNMGVGCEFDALSPAGVLHGTMTHAALYYPENYLAFLRQLEQAQGGGRRADCICCEDNVELVIVAVNDCVVTQLDEFTWRIVQTSGISGAGDPFCEAYDYFTAVFKEQNDRCINIIGSSGTAMSSWQQTNCDGSVSSGIGGGGGEGRLFTWVTKACPPDPTTMDITIIIACPENEEFIPE